MFYEPLLHKNKMAHWHEPHLYLIVLFIIFKNQAPNFAGQFSPLNIRRRFAKLPFHNIYEFLEIKVNFGLMPKKLITVHCWDNWGSDPIFWDLPGIV